jgi:chlorite dismutase
VYSSSGTTLKHFSDLPDILPIRLKGTQNLEENNEEVIAEASALLPEGERAEETKEGTVPVHASVRTQKEQKVFDFRGEQTVEKMAELYSKFELTRTRKLTYDKPICIIYNPHSGRMTNLIPTIELRL